MTLENIIYLISGIIIGIWAAIVTYIAIQAKRQAKIAVNALLKFPTPEQMAKEMLKVKIPLSEIPEDKLNEINQSIGDEMEKLAKKNEMPKGKSTYIG